MDRTELKPASVFHYFDEICQVPRPSKKEEKIIEYLKAFGKKHNLETKFDEVGNVLIKKPATKGKEHLQTVVYSLMSIWFVRRTVMYSMTS